MILRAEKKRGTSDKGNGNGARAKEDKPWRLGLSRVMRVSEARSVPGY